MAKRKTTDTVSFTLRMREDLRAVLEEAAKEKEVSLNHEIVDRLKEALTARLVEANQNVLITKLAYMAEMMEQTMARLERAEELLVKVSERADGGYDILSEEIRDLRDAIVRGNIDPEDRK